jgi:hypothetical protein
MHNRKTAKAHRSTFKLITKTSFIAAGLLGDIMLQDI